MPSDPTSFPTVVDAARWALVSRLADDLGHEIKNPLHAMVINLELLKRRVDRGEAADALERVGVVEEQVERVHVLVNGLLQLIRPARGTAPVELDDVVAELLPLLRARADLAHAELEYREAGPGRRVELDRGALRYIVLAVGMHALDRATGSRGGRVELSTEGGLGNGVTLHARAFAGVGPERQGPPTAPVSANPDWAVVRTLLAEAGGALELDDAAEASGSAAFTVRLPAPLS